MMRLCVGALEFVKVDIHLTKRTTLHQPYTLVQLEPVADWVFDAQHLVYPPSAPGAPTAHE